MTAQIISLADFRSARAPEPAADRNDPRKFNVLFGLNQTGPGYAAVAARLRKAGYRNLGDLTQVDALTLAAQPGIKWKTVHRVIKALRIHGLEMPLPRRHA